MTNRSNIDTQKGAQVAFYFATMPRLQNRPRKGREIQGTHRESTHRETRCPLPPGSVLESTLSYSAMGSVR